MQSNSKIPNNTNEPVFVRLLIITQSLHIARIKMKNAQFDDLQKVHDSEDTKLATFGTSITRQRAAPNSDALVASV